MLLTDRPTTSSSAAESGAEDYAISLRDVTLWRRTQEELHYDLKRLIFALLQRRYTAPRRRRVLHGINLDIRRGEKIGIVGPNGSGKSTMLKLIAGILKPSTGSVVVRGALAPLIELGAGFEPELSVVDNIIYYGVLLGRTHEEMRGRVEAILNFAELEDHANAPLKTLSSGMGARLGFAIATDVRPKILILDEVLSVGDEAFRRKSSERIARFWDAHSTIIVVSHDPAFIAKQCERAILLEGGRIVAVGPATDILRQYDERLASERIILDRELIERLSDRVIRGRGDTDEDRALYLVRDGKRHYIPDPGWLKRAGIRWPDDVVFVESAAIRAMPSGADVDCAPLSTIDVPAPDAFIEPEEFFVTGWARDDGGASWKTVRVCAGDVEVGRTARREPREDVAKVWNLQSSAVGFSAACHVPKEICQSGHLELDIRVEYEGGREVTLDRRIVRI